MSCTAGEHSSKDYSNSLLIAIQNLDTANFFCLVRNLYSTVEMGNIEQNGIIFLTARRSSPGIIGMEEEIL
jgi:hypothetical protein